MFNPLYRDRLRILGDDVLEEVIDGLVRRFVVALGLVVTSEMVRIVSRRECEFGRLGLSRSGKQDKLGSSCCRWPRACAIPGMF